jgi:uncharacterized protein YecT (DUF1311 family)
MIRLGWHSPVGILAAWLALAVPALAQEDPCVDLTYATQPELNQCVFLDWQVADEALNRAYATAVAEARARDASITGEGGAEELLRQAQRAWLAYRDADCEVEASFFEGGQAEPMTRYGCMIQHTEDRTDRLWGYVRIHRPLREDEP